MHENSESRIEGSDAVKQLQILLYAHKLLKKYNFSKPKFVTRNIRYLNTISFEETVYGNQDHNGVAIIPLKLALQLSLASGCWVTARFFSRDFNNRRSHERWIKIIVDYNMKSGDNCYVSLVLYHNLREKLGTQNLAVKLKSEMMIFSVYLITRLFAIWNSKIDSRNIFLEYKSSLQPRFAPSINLSYANALSNLSSKEVENLIEHYFSIPKYLHVGDVIVIPIPVSQSQSFQDSIQCISQSKFLYFVVNSFDKSKDVSTSGYLISKDRSTLYLSGSEKTKIPYLMGIVSTKDEKIPPCLNVVFNKVYSIFQTYQPFLSKRHNQFRSNGEEEIGQTSENKEAKLSRNSTNIFNSQNYDCSAHIMLIGPTGSGKIKIIKLLAEKFSYHVKWVDCLSIKGDTSAATEGKIGHIFASIQPYTIIALTRIGSLSEDKEGNNDPRVFIALKEQFRKFSSMKPRPFIIGTNENQTSISDDLWSLFTYPLVITCPTQHERKRTLLWLLSAYLSLDMNSSNNFYSEVCSISKVVSHRTAGFYLGDLEEYILRIHRCSVERIAQQVTQNSNENYSSKMLIHEDFMKALDEIQEQRSEALGLPRIPKVQWKDVGGLEEAKKELINTIQLPIKHPTIISKSFRRSGILLYGPPGTGKTLLAKSVASECGLNFLSVKGPELINMYVGQSEENVRNAFAKAKSASPCVIFFDELDSLAPKRGRSGDSGGVMDRIVSALLAELDGVSASSDVFVLAATNRPDLLDSALLRPGRLEKQIYLGLCETREDQIKILRAVTSKIPLGQNVSLKRVAENLPYTLTGADFAALGTDAFYIATRRSIKTLREVSSDSSPIIVEVSEDDILEASKNLKPSVSESELKMYKEMKTRRGEKVA